MNVRNLPNIGARMERKLHAAGIETATYLAPEGCGSVFAELGGRIPEVFPVYLYAIGGALTGRPRTASYPRTFGQSSRSSRTNCEIGSVGQRPPPGVSTRTSSVGLRPHRRPAQSGPDKLGRWRAHREQKSSGVSALISVPMGRTRGERN